MPFEIRSLRQSSRTAIIGAARQVAVKCLEPTRHSLLNCSKLASCGDDYPMASHFSASFANGFCARTKDQPAPVDFQPRHLVAERPSRKIEPLHDGADVTARLQQALFNERAFECVNLLFERKCPAWIAMSARIRQIECLQQIRCTVAKHKLGAQRKSLENDIKAFSILMRNSQADAEPIRAIRLAGDGRIDAECRAVAVTHLSLGLVLAASTYLQRNDTHHPVLER